MKTIDRANAARRLKENTDFVEIIACIEADIFESFRNVQLNDQDGLAKIHQLSHGFKLLNQRINKYIEIAVLEANQEAAKEKSY